MRLCHCLFVLTAALLLGTYTPAFADDADTSLSQEAVLTYLEELVQWQRDAASISASTDSPREAIMEDTLQQNAVKALREGFKFSRLQAAISQPAEDVPAEGEAATPRQRMLQRAGETDRLIVQLQRQLSARNLSASQRAALEGTLKLSLAKQELFATVLANINAASTSDSKGLGGKIDNLARGIPELNPEMAKAAAKAAAAAPATALVVTARPVNSILSLADDLFTVTRKQRELKAFLAQTTQLAADSHALMKILRGELDTITGAATPSSSIDEQVATFKQIGSVIVPLGDATLWINASKATLADWQEVLDQRFKTLLRQLTIELAILAVTLAIPLLLGEAARRAIAHYVTDPKRKRQANTARRILVAIGVVFILMLTFISDFSSFATFAGFMTAGLAVALQSVLLSLVGHFFFYGRYGVRPGDRVKVGNVIGDILQVGMMRFYLRELHTNKDGTLEPTGKVVAFPNSILFQPTAFYKYLPEAPADRA